MEIKTKGKFWLLLIIILSLMVRTYGLDRLSLFGDELDVGYHAYSLWTTGRDYMGQKLPLYIHSFSEWRAPLLMYVTAPFVGIFGLNEWGVRLPPVIFGVLDILFLYLLVKTVSKKEGLALISAFLLAITPWHIHYSRAAFEVTLLLFLLLLGTLGVIKGGEKRVVKKSWLMVGALAFTLSFYTYSTADLFVPLWLLSLGLVYKKRFIENFSKLIIPLFLFLLLTLPVLMAILRGQGSARFKLISIFNNPKTIDQIVFKRTTGLTNRRVERLFHNKITGWGKEFIGNYLTAFSPQFLFLSGDFNPRHNQPGFGEFYWILAPFLLIGIFDLLKSRNILFKHLVFVWLLLAPIASCLTVGGGNQATRLFLALPPLVILIALGWQSSIKWFFKFRLLFIAFSFLFLVFSLFFWLHSYFIHYPKEQFRFWGYGYKEAMEWLMGNENNYQRVIINNSYNPSLLPFLFWTKKDPRWFHKTFVNDQLKEEVLPNFRGFWLGRKWLFGETDIQTRQESFEWFLDKLDSKSIYLAVQGEEIPGDWDWSKDAPADFVVLKVIYDPHGKPLMYWITKK